MNKHRFTKQHVIMPQRPLIAAGADINGCKPKIETIDSFMNTLKKNINGTPSFAGAYIHDVDKNGHTA